MKKSIKLLTRAETCADVILNNKWENNGHKSIVTKIGGVAFLNVLVRYGDKTNGTTICTIPTGFRPYQTLIAFAISATQQTAVIIYPTGEIKLTGAITENSNVSIVSSWIIGS